MVKQTAIRLRRRLVWSGTSADVCVDALQLTPQVQREMVLAVWARTEAAVQEPGTWLGTAMLLHLMSRGCVFIWVEV